MKKKLDINNDFTEVDFQDILEYHPNWFIKWGVTIVAVIVLLLIFLSYYVSEPEVIKSKYILNVDESGNISSDTVLHLNKKIICKVYLDVNGKRKLIKGKNVELELYSKNSGKYFSVEGVLDSLKFNTETDNYIAEISIKNLQDSSFKREVYKDGLIEGDVRIIIDKKSLFDRIFSKYKEINRL